MSTLLWILALIAVPTALAYRQASIARSTVVMGALLLVLTLFSDFPGMLLAVFWLAFVAVAAVFNLGGLRRSVISGPAFKFFKNVLPEMSDTERDALEAGTVWWEGDLFAGKPNWHKWLANPKPRLSREEQAFLDGPVEEFCAMQDEWEITHELADMSPESWAFAKKHKFFGMIIPKEYGGLEFSATAHSEVLAKVASAGGCTVSSLVAVPNSLGPAELLLHYGTDAQKDYYLPRLAVGDEIPCFGLTNPYAGSDAGAIPDRGVVCKGKHEGKEVLGMRLNFEKRYITLAPVATVIGLAFKLYDPDHLLGEADDIGITCALIPRDTDGVEIGRRHFPVNAPFMNGPIKGTDVFVPLDFIIGGADNAGRGWRMLMEVLSIGRSISLPSCSMGGAAMAAHSTGAYARVRKQLNIPIGEFEGIQEAMGRIGARTYAIDAVRRSTALAVDLGEKPSVPSAIAKMHVTDISQKVAIDAMDVHAGKAVCLGPRNLIGRSYQNAPVQITVEGANILTRSMMIFGQGAIRCHPYVLAEMEAVADDNAERGLQAFDAALMSHIGHVARAKARSFVLGLSGGRLASSPVDGPTARYYRGISRYSANLAFLADIAMASLGGSLKFKESISARLGDVLSDLYMCSCVLKRYEDEGRNVDDLPLVEWFMAERFKHIEDQIDGVLRHLPVGPLRAGLRLVVFPLGRRAVGPSDSANAAVAKLMMTPGQARERLAAVVYKPTDRAKAMGVLIAAFDASIAAEPIERKLLKAYKSGQITHPHPQLRIDEAEQAGVLSAAEAAQMQETFDLVAEVIAVDDFTTQDLMAGQGEPARTVPKKPAARKPAAKAAPKSAPSPLSDAAMTDAGSAPKPQEANKAPAAAKKASARKPAARKTPAKKPAAKKPAGAKSAKAKPASKPAAKKPAASKPVAKKPAPKKKAPESA